MKLGHISASFLALGSTIAVAMEPSLSTGTTEPSITVEVNTSVVSVNGTVLSSSDLTVTRTSDLTATSGMVDVSTPTVLPTASLPTGMQSTQAVSPLSSTSTLSATPTISLTCSPPPSSSDQPTFWQSLLSGIVSNLLDNWDVAFKVLIVRHIAPHVANWYYNYQQRRHHQLPHTNVYHGINHGEHGQRPYHHANPHRVGHYGHNQRINRRYGFELAVMDRDGPIRR